MVIGVLIVLRGIKRSLRSLAGGKVKEHFRKAVYRVFQIIVWIVAFFLIFGVWGVNITGLLAGAGFMGIVVGLSAQETLGNIISGLVMMFSRPFEVGDWIEIAGYSGVVEEIAVINTRIRTFNGEVLSIPNQMVSSNEINNKSSLDKLRIKKTIGIDYESDSQKAREIAKEELENHELIMDDPAPKALIDELSDSSVDIVLLFWIEDPLPKKEREISSDIIISIKERFEENDIGIPFPHMELIQHEERGWKLNKEKE